MKKGWIIFIVAILLLIAVAESLLLTGLHSFFVIGNQGGKVSYGIPNVQNFVQCFDADPQNDNMVKSVCHAQFYQGEKKSLVGMNAVDYCKTKNEVVDFYCARDFSCQERLTECEKGFTCDDGKCIEREKLLKLPSLGFGIFN